MDGMGIAALGSGLWAFPPSRDSDGGTAWLLHTSGGGSVLVDVPLLSDEHLSWLQQQPPGWIVLTHRQGHGRCRRLQEQLGWPVLVQEQEAYLLPNVSALDTFAVDHVTASGLRLLWTPGPTPGSCVVHAPAADLLFCGRLLTPLAPGRLGPLRHGRTFHWPRQLGSLQRLRGWIPSDARPQLASGAGLGALRGERLVPFSGWDPSLESS